MSEKAKTITAAVWWELFKKALVWLIPALLVLPFYLILIAVTAVAADGSLLATTEGVRGGINAAIGPLLVLCGIAAVVATVLLATDAQDYVNGVFFALATAGLGVALVVRELRLLAGLPVKA
jgi:hypothetical protein